MLGNLDSLPLGMGLRAYRKQLVPAKYAGLQGFDAVGASKPVLTLGLILAILLFLNYKK